MINDETFRQELDAALKRQGILKKDRNNTISLAMSVQDDDRDKVLDNEEENARKHEAEKRKAKHVPTEFKEQCDFVAWFKSEYPGVVIMSIRNGGHRLKSERQAQLLEGLHPGAADLYIPAWRMWIEFKRVKGGVLSDAQERFADYVMNVCGDRWILAEGFESGKSQIMEYILNK